ncbi:Gfo/Idh/MocA family oxidoreductase [soil metagenome]
MTIKVGIIGASFAKAAFLPALATIDKAEVVAIASARLDSARATAAAFGVENSYDDWKTMLGEHTFDLVCIATPTFTHAPMTLGALEAGAHVLCDKPMALNSEEARAMLETAEALGRIHMVDHELRFNPTRQKIKDLIDSGAIGEVRHVNIVNITPSWGDPASRPKDDWWSLAEKGGGRLGANGSHQIDLLRWWFGDVASVMGQVKTMVPDRVDKDTGEPWSATADDVAWFTLELQNGTLASVFMSGVARHNLGNHTQIFGSEGSILLSNDDEILKIAKMGEDFEDITINDPNADLPGVNKGIWNVSVVGLMNELVGAIQEKRPLAQGATFEDGLKCQQVMDAVRQSSKERKWIDLA